MAARTNTRRILLAVAIGVIHAAALIVLFTAAPPRKPDPVLDRVIALVTHPAPAPKPEPPTPPTPPRPVPVPAIVAAPTITIAPDIAAPALAMSGSPGEGCAIERGIADALAVDSVARAALAAIGPARAETGAINLWNGIWVTPPDTDTDTDTADASRLATLRPTVRAAIAAAAPECGAVEQIGPRLIAVPGQARPTLLVIGSGRWRWRDLLQDAPPH